MKSLAKAWSLAAALAIGGCGGSNGSPAAPSPGSTPASDGAAACSALTGGGTSSLIGIFTGTACSTGSAAVVLLNLRDKSDNAVAQCSGTVIAPRAVLTAAHCLQGNVAVVKIYRGSGAQLDATSFQPHPDYRETSGASPDVGVVLTGEDLQRPALSLLLSRDATVGERAVIAGWGLDENDQLTQLRAGMTTISGTSPGFLLARYTFGSGSSGVCNGDSGGPLLLAQGGAWSIAGVTSATSDTLCRDTTNYFTNVRTPSVRAFITNLVPGVGSR